MTVVVGLGDDQPELLRTARDLAETYDVPLRVVHTYWTSASSADLSRGRDASDLARSAAELVLDRARERMGSTGDLRVEYETTLSTVAHGLEAESATATLVVVGRHRAAWPGLLRTGHVTRHVALHAHCPVVIVPPGDAATGQDVVVAIDVGSVSTGSLDFATDLGRRWGATVRAVSVVAADLTGPGREQHHARLDRVVHDWRGAGIDLSTHVVPGDAHEALREITQAARIVVVGRPRRLHEAPAPGRSVVMTLLRDTSCPVAVVA